MLNPREDVNHSKYTTWRVKNYFHTIMPGVCLWYVLPSVRSYKSSVKRNEKETEKEEKKKRTENEKERKV